MLIRGDTGDEVELTWKVDGPSLDLEVVVRVTYAGFSGSVATWVSRDTWEAFSWHLAELEHRRAGEARLNAISPDELLLRIFAIDGRGHVGVEGFLGKRGATANCRLDFGCIEFDPTSLTDIVSTVTRGGSAGATRTLHHDREAG